MLIASSARKYMDEADIERTAGLLEILGKEQEEQAYLTAALVFRILGQYDIKTAEDFTVIFRRSLGVTDGKN